MDIAEHLGFAVAGEEAGAGTDRHPLQCHAPRHQAAVVAQGAVAQRQIEPVIKKIDHAVVEVHVDPESGVPFGKLHQERRDAAPAEEHRHRHAQPSRDLAPPGLDHRFPGAQFVERLAAPLVIGKPVLRQLLGARRSVEKPYPEPLFEPRDTLADGRA